MGIDWERYPEWEDISGNSAVTYIHDMMTNPPGVVSTGLPSIDRSMHGFGQQAGIPLGSYVIVGGASNVGKTQFGLHLGRKAAEAGERVGFVSLDMKKRDAMLRIHQAIVGPDHIPLGHWRPDRWKSEYYETLQEGLRRWRLSTTGSFGMFPVPSGREEWVRAVIEEGIERGISFFVVDHLQKIKIESERDVAARAEALSDMLDDYTDKHNVTIVGLSQLKRTAAEDRKRRPQMTDLLGGTSLESNTAVVLMLDHSRYHRDPEQHHIARTWVVVDKNQMGPKGFEVPVVWDHRTLALREALEDELEEDKRLWFPK